MGVKEEYLAYRKRENLSTRRFEDRVVLQRFLRDRLDEMWEENPKFSHGGLFSNDMAGLALGFAYYDCEPTPFYKTRRYGLPSADVFDFNMFRLAVITSEALKTVDSRYLDRLLAVTERLKCLKIGHWGDAVPAQIPTIAEVARRNPHTTCW